MGDTLPHPTPCSVARESGLGIMRMEEKSYPCSFTGYSSPKSCPCTLPKQQTRAGIDVMAKPWVSHPLGVREWRADLAPHRLQHLGEGGQHLD